MRRATTILMMAATVTSVSALAEGLRVRDLTSVETAARAVLGKDAESRAAPERLTLTCPTCAGAPVVDLLIGKQADGTEERVRSGATTVASLEALCRAREPSCRMERADVGPAVGWLSSYNLGAHAGGTLILIANGDLLTTRVVASDSETVRATLKRLKAEILPSIVGR